MGAVIDVLRESYGSALYGIGFGITCVWEFLAVLWLSCVWFDALTPDSSVWREAATAMRIGR